MEYLNYPFPRGHEPQAYVSAYGIAVKNGFWGTEEEWLESLKAKGLEAKYEGGELLYRNIGSEDGWLAAANLGELIGEALGETKAEFYKAVDLASGSATSAAESADAAELAASRASDERVQAELCRAAAENAAQSVKALSAEVVKDTSDEYVIRLFNDTSIDVVTSNLKGKKGDKGDRSAKVLNTSFFESGAAFEVGEKAAYVDIDMVCSDFIEGDFIFDHCGYVFMLSEIRPDEYYVYMFQCLGKWLAEDGKDGIDGKTIYSLFGTPSYNDDAGHYYQWINDDTLYRVGELMLFDGDSTLYRVRERFLGINGNPNCAYLERVTGIGSDGLKLSDFENDAGFLAYDSTERVFDANEYFDFKIAKTMDVTENLPSSVPVAKRWGLIFTLLENATRKTGVQYFFDSGYRIYTRNCYSGSWSGWHIIADPNDDANALKTYKLQNSGYGDGVYTVNFNAKSTLSSLQELFLFIPTVSNAYGENYINLGEVGAYRICYRTGTDYSTMLPEGFFQPWRAVMLAYNGGYFEVLNYWG